MSLAAQNSVYYFCEYNWGYRCPKEGDVAAAAGSGNKTKLEGVRWPAPYSKPMHKQRAVVTGGAGYVGHRLGLALAAQGHEVLLLDLAAPAEPLPPGVEFNAADIRNLDSLQRLFSGAVVVFHVASYGMSGRQQLQHKLITEVNIHGIYGPGEQRHLPRVVAAVEMCLFKFVYGSPASLVDFVHVDNLVQAHLLAAEALGPTQNGVAAGQPYFISDDSPVNNFEFFRPLVEGLGYNMPRVRVPLQLVFWAEMLTELLHAVVWGVYNFQPLLTRAEVYKTGVTHFFRMDKARRELGYNPQRYSFDPVVQWFRDRGHGATRKKRDATGVQADWPYVLPAVQGPLIFLPLLFLFLLVVLTEHYFLTLK